MKSFKFITYAYLFIVLLCWRMGKDSVFGNPLHDETTMKTASKMETGDSSTDYYNDDEESPGEQVKKDLETTMTPYFETNNTIKYAAKGQKVILDCPAKNFSEKHNILWYKDKNNVAAGQLSLSADYEVNKNFSLIIKELTPKMVGNYSCSVLPQDVRHDILLEIVKEQKPNVTTTTKLPEIKKEENSQTAITGSAFSILYFLLLISVLTSWQMGRM